MIRLLSVRSLAALALLWIAATALVWTLNTSLAGLGHTAFLSLAITALMTTFLLGFSNWPSYRVWLLILFFGFPLIAIQATHTGPEVWGIISHIPSLLLEKMFASMTNKPADMTVFQAQLDAFFLQLQVFAEGVSPDGHTAGPSLLELLWSIPLFLSCAWAGWWTSRQNSILIALIPSLAMQAYLLNYAHRLQGLTLQIGAFVLIVLMGLHQKWSLSDTKNQTELKVRFETYARVLILSTVLALAAGLVPIIPAPQQVTPTPKPGDQSVATRVVEQSTPPPADIPEVHPILTPPPHEMTVIFLANIAQEPFPGTDDSAAGRYYWRWLAYDRYDGKAWSSSPTNNAAYAAQESLYEFNGPGYRVVHQTILKAGPNDKHLYWTGSLLRADQPIQVTWRTPPSVEKPLFTMDMLGSLIQTQQYSADSLLPQWNEAQMRAATQVYPTEIMEKYLPLPNAISQRVRDLAITLTADAHNPYDKAQAIEAYLRTYPYTLDVPPVPANREIADYFLFELKTGYCDYYSTSMVVLARAIGLPARIVMGYASSELDPQNGQYIVRGGNAHSWAEIYFPDLGWIQFEPTANQPLIERPLLPAPPANTATPTAPPTATPTPTPTPDPAQPVTPPKDRAQIPHGKMGHFIKHHLNPAVLVFMLAVICILLIYLRTQGLWFSYKSMAAIYKYIYRQGRRIHSNTPFNATPSLFAEQLKPDLSMNHRFLFPSVGQLNHLTSLYLKETYSPHAVSQVELKRAVKIWQQLFWRLLYVRIMLTLPLRLRGLFAARKRAAKA